MSEISASINYKEVFENKHGSIMSWDDFVTAVQEFDIHRHDDGTSSLKKLNHTLDISHSAFYKWVARARLINRG